MIMEEGLANTNKQSNHRPALKTGVHKIKNPYPKYLKMSG